MLRLVKTISTLQRSLSVQELYGLMWKLILSEDYSPSIQSRSNLCSRHHIQGYYLAETCSFRRSGAGRIIGSRRSLAVFELAEMLREL